MMISAATPTKPLATRTIFSSIAASPDRYIGTEKPVGLVPRIVFVRQRVSLVPQRRGGTVAELFKSMDQ
jgi:hypothetical protein